MSMEANYPWGVTNLDPRGMVGRIHVGEHEHHDFRVEFCKILSS